MKGTTAAAIVYGVGLLVVTTYYQVRLEQAHRQQQAAERLLIDEMTRKPRRCYKTEEFRWIVMN